MQVPSVGPSHSSRYSSLRLRSILLSPESGTRIPCWEHRLSFIFKTTADMQGWGVGLGQRQVKVPQNFPTIFKLPFNLALLEFWQNLFWHFFTLFLVFLLRVRPLEQLSLSSASFYFLTELLENWRLHTWIALYYYGTSLQ